MTDLAERSRFYGKYDTGIWPNHALMVRAVMSYDDLTKAEKRRWNRMCADLDIDPDVGL